MCVLLITRLLRGVGRWSRKPVDHTSWVAVVTPTDRPKSVRNCCLIELFCGVVCVVTLPLWHFCWYRGFCHRTGSDLLIFVSINSKYYHHACSSHLLSGSPAAMDMSPIAMCNVMETWMSLRVGYHPIKFLYCTWNKWVGNYIPMTQSVTGY